MRLNRLVVSWVVFFRPFFLMVGLQNVTIALIASIAGPMVIVYKNPETMKKRIAIIFIIMAVFILPFTHKIDMLTTGWNHIGLISTVDSPYSRLTITRQGNQLMVVENDVLEFDDRKCQCGSFFRVVRQIHGRKDDIFILNGMNDDDVYLFPDYVRRSINQSSNRILEYQAIMRNREEIEIRLIIEEGESHSLVQNKIIENLNRYFTKINAIKPQIIFSHLQPEKNPRSGKLIRVVNLMDSKL